MWQWLVIAPLVAASAAYAAWALMPAPTRLRFARWLAHRAAGGPAPLAGLAARLERAALPSGGCDSCPASRVATGADRKPPAR
ncbi:MAG: hypothetical protein H6R27_1215 [Proteobacteria bacterium]|nr:hypothetical protein [Pseudomonadota bacterium]